MGRLQKMSLRPPPFVRSFAEVQNPLIENARLAKGPPLPSLPPLSSLAPCSDSEEGVIAIPFRNPSKVAYLPSLLCALQNRGPASSSSSRSSCVCSLPLSPMAAPSASAPAVRPPSSLPACLARAPRRVVGRPSVADPAPGGPVQVRLLPPFFALIGRTRCVGTRFQANLWSSSSGLGGDSDFNGDDGAGGGREGGSERAKGHFALGSVCPQPRGRGGV